MDGRTTTVQTVASRHSAGIKTVVAGMVLAVAGSLALSAWAEAPGGGRAGGHAMHGRHGGGWGGGMGGPGLFMGSPERIDRGVERWLEGLNTTEAQRSQVKQIAQAAARDLRAQREASRGLHEQGMKLFAAPVVDARAVEALRQQRLAQHDQASKRMTQAMLDVSAVLTPEQRATLAQRMEQRRQQMQERMQQRRGAASAPSR